MEATMNEAAKRQAGWAKCWAAWIAAETPEQKAAALRNARAWAARTRESLPLTMTK
jgi:hypothetical protein